MEAEIVEVVLDTCTKYYIETKRNKVRFIIEPQSHGKFYSRDTLRDFYESRKGETYMDPQRGYICSPRDNLVMRKRYFTVLYGLNIMVS